MEIMVYVGRNEEVVQSYPICVNSLKELDAMLNELQEKYCDAESVGYFGGEICVNCE